VDGIIMKSDMSTAESSMPASQVRPPVDREPRACDQPTAPLFALLALESVFISNQLKLMRGEEPSPVGLVGGAGSVTKRVGGYFAEIAGMKSIQVKDGGQKVIEQFHKKMPEFDYPVFVDVIYNGLMGEYSATEHDYVIMSLDILDAAALATGFQWDFIVNVDKWRETPPLPPFDDVLRYLQHLQKNNFNTIDDPTPHVVLKDYVGWYAKQTDQPVEPLLNGALSMLKTRLTPGLALLDLFQWLRHYGRMGIAHLPFARMVGSPVMNNPKRETCYIDDEAKLVFLPGDVIRRQSKRRSLIEPEMTNTINELITSDIKIGRAHV